MRGAVLFVVIFHSAVFVAEALLWMQDGVHRLALPKLNYDLTFAPDEQARILRRLFVNQGFYNLFLATAGALGLYQLRRGNTAVGHTLIGYMCLSAVGAGVVLALSTRAYGGALLQAGPAAFSLWLLFRAQRRQLPHG
jgi:putative membrane protein